MIRGSEILKLRHIEKGLPELRFGGLFFCWFLVPFLRKLSDDNSRLAHDAFRHSTFRELADFAWSVSAANSLISEGNRASRKAPKAFSLLIN